MKIAEQIKALKKNIEDAKKKIAELEAKKKEMEDLAANMLFSDEEAESFNQAKEVKVLFGKVSKLNKNADFEARVYGPYANNGIFLGPTDFPCMWKIVNDKDGAWVLVLKK